MKKFTANGKEYWGGKNQKLGLVIYDPSSQLNVDNDKVRLFKVNEQKSDAFLKNIIKTKLVNCSNEELSLLQGAINKYADTRKKQRVTHCYNCKRHLDSVDFSICEKCNWIKCSCGACGCGYTANL